MDLVHETIPLCMVRGQKGIHNFFIYIIYFRCKESYSSDGKLRAVLLKDKSSGEEQWADSHQYIEVSLEMRGSLKYSTFWLSVFSLYTISLGVRSNFKMLTCKWKLTVLWLISVFIAKSFVSDWAKTFHRIK